MARPPKPPPTTAARLSRLRLRMTLLYVVLSTVGFVGLAVLALVIDSRAKTSLQDDALYAQAEAAFNLVYYPDAGSPLNLDDLKGDRSTKGPTVIAVYERDKAGALQERYLSKGSSDPVDMKTLAATVGPNDENGVRGETNDATGLDWKLIGVPFYDFDGNNQTGVVVAAVDTGPTTDAHHNLAVELFSAVGLLVLLSAGVGWILAGRSLRPAAAALDQQESFLANAAHELRTPVARLRAVAESAQLSSRTTLAALPPGIDDDTREAAGDLAFELDRLVFLTEQSSQTVNDLLSLARMQSDRLELKRESVDLQQLSAAIGLAYPELHVYANEPIVIIGDTTLLRRAIENLVENALLHAGGPPPDNLGAVVELWVQRDGLNVKIVVADNGPGIPDDILPVIFERFRSGNTSTGSGLGMAIVLWVVEHHRGTVTAMNRQPEWGHGTGAVFTITLPIAPG